MRTLFLWLPLTLVLALPGTAPAQDAEASMAEDIEIMRRLLAKELLNRQTNQCIACHQPSSLVPHPDGKHLFSAQDITARVWDVEHFHVATSLHSHGSVPEGFYLKGHGVVYTATLPPQRLKDSSTKSKPIPKPQSDWDRIRNELRGEKLAGAEKPQQFEPPSLADAILEVLAKNGRHFSQLPENEKLTVVVAFRDIGEKAQPKAESPKQVKDLELQGDLHLRQGNLKEAVAAYEKGLKASSSLAAKKTFYRKLSLGYFQFEDPRSMEYMKKYEEAKAAPQAPARQWPKRLIVSATKGVLDRVAANTMTFEEFRSAAQVEYQFFPAVREKDKPK